MYKYRYTLLISLIAGFLSFTLLFTSCRKDNDEEEQERIEENEEFYKLMIDWYYWYNEMPSINPRNYFSPYEVLEALRKRPLDRWSYISSREEFESYYLESKFIGYGFGSAWDQNGKLRVTFIFNTTDIYEAGVRRSWIIERINGVAIQPGMNINQMLGANEVGVTNTFVIRNPGGSEITLTLQKKEVIMNTVLYKEVFEAGGRKAGYLVLKGFTTPTVAELDEAFEFFTAEGIDELILDLRYNGGGQTNVANYLASIIGGTSVTDQPFAKYLYNDKRARDENFTDEFATVENSPSLDRLIVIATRATASASEMVINGLNPFVQVYLVGDNTYGKPMGMNAWYYGDKYAFVPVTFKIANALDQGDYFNGLEADSYVDDNISLPFGDPEEASLKEALKFIETGTFSGLPKKKSLFVQPWEQMTGLRAEIGTH